MSQSDYNIGANPSGLNMRTEINQIFDSILTHNSGSTAPTVTKAFMMWVDTSNATYYYLKMRNHDNTAWVTLGIYTVATKTYTSYAEDTVKLTENQTIDGVKTFTTSPVVPTPTTTGNIITMGKILEKTPVGIGYGTGAGGTVQQLTSKSTAVTLNKPTGFIGMSIGSLAAGASVTFTFNNSLLSSADTLNIVIYSDSIATQGSYRLTWSIKPALAYITLTNQSASALNEAPLLNFAITKGANS